MDIVKEVIVEMLKPEQLAIFLITVLGVFIGFLLSAWNYKKRQSKNRSKLENTYISLIKDELEKNLEILKGCKESIEPVIEEYNNQNEKEGNRLSRSDKDKIANLIMNQNMKVILSDKAINSALSAGAIKPLTEGFIFVYINNEVLIDKMERIEKIYFAEKVTMETKGYLQGLLQVYKLIVTQISVMKEVISRIEKQRENRSNKWFHFIKKLVSRLWP